MDDRQIMPQQHIAVISGKLLRARKRDRLRTGRVREESSRSPDQIEITARIRYAVSRSQNVDPIGQQRARAKERPRKGLQNQTRNGVGNSTARRSVSRIVHNVSGADNIRRYFRSEVAELIG